MDELWKSWTKVERFRDWRGKSGVYAIRNVVNGKLYIGSAMRSKYYSLSSRLSMHFNGLIHNKHRNKHLQYSWNKYGKENFEFFIIEVLINPIKQLILEKEQYWIDYYKNKNNKMLYNICPIAGNLSGVKQSQQSIDKARLKKIGRGFKNIKHCWDIKIGEKFGKIIVVGKPFYDFGKRRGKWKIDIICECEEGIVKTIDPAKLIYKQISSCGCEERKHQKNIAKIGQYKREQKKFNNNLYKGVKKIIHQYEMRININSKQYYLHFGTELDAAEHYDYYTIKYRGSHCYLNFPNKDYSDFKPKKTIKLERDNNKTNHG